jgi:hypothetical protein
MSVARKSASNDSACAFSAIAADFLPPHKEVVMKKILFLSCLMLSGVAQAQTVEEVGDPDSFGRDVTYLGVATVGPFFLNPDCIDEIAAGYECVVPLPGLQTTVFAATETDSIQLPARASNSLLCFALTPTTIRRFNNPAATPSQAILSARALLTIESSVLQNPALIDPNTGLPFNGKIDITFNTHNEIRRIAAGDFDSLGTQFTRSCQGALISKRALTVSYGLTQSQANSFFNNRITVRMGLAGSSRNVETLTHSVGIRLYGDRR